MEGKRILGIFVVMTMVLTAMPLLTGNAKATNSTEHVPSYLVIVRTPYDQDGTQAPAIDKTIGNAYQDDKFGVEVIVHADKYEYDPTGYDIIKLNITGIGVKGENANQKDEWGNSYKIEWLEIDSTKFSFEERNSDRTPHATDYDSALESAGVHNVAVGLRGSVEESQEIKWFREISDTVAGTATSLAVDYASGGTAGPLSGLAGDGASNLVDKAIKSMFNTANAGKNYPGSDRDPWYENPDHPFTYMALRGVTNGESDNPSKTLLARAFQWNLYDGINNKVHVLTLKATLCYARFGHYWIYTGFNWIPRYGWYNEHKISTSVTIYVAPQSMVNEINTRGETTNITKRTYSDPASPSSYYLKVDTDTESYTSTMPQENTQNTPRTDSGYDRAIHLFSGSFYNSDTGLTDTYYYYRGALPISDNIDKYYIGFAKYDDYDTNQARIWIHTSGDIKVTINYQEATYTYTMKGGKSKIFAYSISYSGNAYITIEKLNTDTSVSYYISAYGYYYGYSGGGSSGGGSGGGGGGGGGGPPGPPHFRSIPSSWGHESDTAPNSP